MAFTFLRWLRTGMAASLDAQPQAAGSARRAKITMGVEVSADGLPNQVASVDLDVLGPGDVTGIDSRQVIRMFPVAGTPDFEPTYHAHVELDRPDLPWLFTPFGPATSETLRPWIALVVVEQGEHGALTPGVPLPKLTVGGPEVARLPALDQAHAWAHVQVTGDTSADAERIAAEEPERILSRLVCPRMLDPDKSYLACVVPTFAIGAMAGLGREIPATVPLDAWAASAPTVELPVYHHWEFSTSGAGDFRSLVLRLEGKTELPGVGTRPLDVTSPGFGLSDRPAPATVPLGGVFRVDAPAAAPVDRDLADELEPALNASDEVSPPIYGRWHTAATQVAVPAHSGTAAWLDALNLDPRYRVAAGLGTQVVQERQEDLMAAIWEQLGEILRANQLLRQAQLAVAASERVLARHLTPLPDAALLAVAGPAVARIRLAPGMSMRGAVAASCLPLMALSGAFRKIVRSRGPIARRLGRTGQAAFPDAAPPPAIDLPALLGGMAAGAPAVPDPQLPHGAVPVPAGAGFRWRGGRPPGRPPFDPPAGDAGPLEELADTFAVLARRARGGACSALPVRDMGTEIRAALAPDVAVAGRARALVKLPPSSRVVASARLDPVMAAPEIPTPMIGPLQELGPEWLLPGIGAMPANTVAVVEPDAAVIGAYMAGLNHEIGRELLWRGFPTDQRGTVFARFWDRRGAVPTATAPVPERDIADIHTWDAADELGSHVAQAGKKLVVLLIRGELLQRYPRPTIYAQRGRWARDVGGAIVFDGDLAQREPVPLADPAAWEADVRFPAFTGRAGDDVMFLGFPLSKDDVRGTDRDEVTPRARDDTAGWYLVFEEQPTEPRFGPPTTPLPAPADLRSDALAATLLRQAFRLFVHASDLVGP